MAEPVSFSEIVVALIAFAAGVGVGLALRLVFGWFGRHARVTRWAGDDVIFGLLRDLSLPICVVGGVWVGVANLPFKPNIRDVADRVLVAALVLAATLVLARLVAEGTRTTMVRRTGIGASASIFVNIARLTVLVVGALVVLDSLGISIAPLLTALGVGGLAVALALQDTLANLFAGVHILASKKVQPGDFVALDTGQEGYIVDINWRNTTIRQLPNNHLIVPNATFAQSIVVNYYRPVQEMSVLVQVGVAYGSDLPRVEEVSIEVGREVMREVPGGVPMHEPMVRFHTFGDSSVNFSVILRAKEYTDRYLITHEFVKRLHARYAAEGIEIPFPMRTVVLRDGAPQRHPQPVPVDGPSGQPAP